MSLEIQQLSISNSRFQLFENFNLLVNKGEIFSIMGPSGSGKSTLLSYISGTIDPYCFQFSGRIFRNRLEITHLNLEQRKVGILFQDDLLFPHMNVEQNLAFAISFEVGKQERKKRIATALQSAQMERYEKVFPNMLSGGQRSRISLLRTLLAEPQIFLLDEPFSKLDMALKKEFREFTFDYIKRLHIPTILVTHDQEDVPEKSHLIELPHPREIVC